MLPTLRKSCYSFPYQSSAKMSKENGKKRRIGACRYDCDNFPQQYENNGSNIGAGNRRDVIYRYNQQQHQQQHQSIGGFGISKFGDHNMKQTIDDPVAEVDQTQQQHHQHPHEFNQNMGLSVTDPVQKTIHNFHGVSTIPVLPNYLPQSYLPQSYLPQSNKYLSKPPYHMSQRNIPPRNIPPYHMPQRNLPPRNLPPRNIPQRNIPPPRNQPTNFRPGSLPPPPPPGSQIKSFLSHTPVINKNTSLNDIPDRVEEIDVGDSDMKSDEAFYFGIQNPDEMKINENHCDSYEPPESFKFITEPGQPKFAPVQHEGSYSIRDLPKEEPMRQKRSKEINLIYSGRGRQRGRARGGRGGRGHGRGGNGRRDNGRRDGRARGRGVNRRLGGRPRGRDRARGGPRRMNSGQRGNIDGGVGSSDRTEHDVINYAKMNVFYGSHIENVNM